MKSNVPRGVCLSVLTVLLVSVILAAVFAKEKRHNDVLDPLNADNEIESVKVPRGKRGGWGICHHGLCGRRRSKKRGFQWARADFVNDDDDFGDSGPKDTDIPPKEETTSKKGQVILNSDSPQIP